MCFAGNYNYLSDKDEGADGKTIVESVSDGLFVLLMLLKEPW